MLNPEDQFWASIFEAEREFKRQQKKAKANERKRTTIRKSPKSVRGRTGPRS